MVDPTDPAEVLLAFSQTQKTWMQDAFRRVCTKRHLDETDYSELLALLAASDSPPAANESPGARPLTVNDLPQRPSAAPRTILASLSGVENANRLAREQSLHFAADGVTLIYGENGSGKSGYVRVLKKLCRVRAGSEEDILQDVFARTAGGQARATVRLKVGEEEPSPLDWKDGSTPPPELSRISVFDSKAAPIYADAESKVQVLPYLLDVLPRLGNALTELKLRLDAEEKRLDERVRQPLDTAPVGTPAASLVLRLQSSVRDQNIPSETELRKAGEWTDQDQAELQRVEDDLRSDPALRASSIRAQAKSLRSVADQVQSISTNLSIEAITKVRQLIASRDAARAAAMLAATAAFANIPLSGVGSEPWRLMFLYARAYSELAYPAQAFPVTQPGSRCPLCQQVLDPDAAERLRRFDEHVRAAAAAEVERQEEALRSAAQAIRSLAIPERVTLEALLSAAGLQANMSHDIIGYCVDAKGLCDRVPAAVERGVLDPQENGLGTPPEAGLRETADLLDAEASRLDKLATDPVQTQRLRERREILLGVRFIFTRLSTLLTRREELETRRRVRLLKRECDTTAVSKKNTDLRRQFLTKEFEERLRAELSCLDLAYLPVKVIDSTDRGASVIGIGLNTQRPVRNSTVLSEGEFRGLALAAFLAEIGGYADLHGIIVDDPVSSLDHRHRCQVAERLVAEAKNGRQVIVFTHDLAFFHEIREAAAASQPQVPLVSHEMRVTAKHGCGTVYLTEEPWIAKKVESRLEELRKRLPEIASHTDRSSDEYRRLVKDFCTDLRETWERLVEQVLLNGVVGRFQLGVKTQNLRGVSVDDDDHVRVFVEMTRSSRDSGHDRAQGLQPANTSPEDLQREVDAVSKYVKDLKARRKDVEGRRRAREEAPKGQII